MQCVKLQAHTQEVFFKLMLLMRDSSSFLQIIYHLLSHINRRRKENYVISLHRDARADKFTVTTYDSKCCSYILDLCRVCSCSSSSLTAATYSTGLIHKNKHTRRQDSAPPNIKLNLMILFFASRGQWHHSSNCWYPRCRFNIISNSTTVVDIHKSYWIQT